MTILKYLNISTAHLTEHTVNVWATALPNPWPVLANFEYGLILNVSDLELDDEPLPQDMKDLVAYARTVGCDLIKVDCDADTISELPTYGW